jgi:hypothetical protein
MLLKENVSYPKPISKSNIHVRQMVYPQISTKKKPVKIPFEYPNAF